MARQSRRSHDAGWPSAATACGHVTIGFDADADDDRIGNISAAARAGGTLFLGSDEGADIDRLGRGRGDRWDCRDRIVLADLLDLTDAYGEADIEGLAVDDGWLWIAGSHARTRRKPEKADDACIDLVDLADLKDTRPRCLLARMPLIAEPGGEVRPVARDGRRRAGMLPQKNRGNAIAKALRDDPLLEPFTRIPAKEGGIDVEGLAVAGDRVALGMRGPVIAGHALMLELRVAFRPKGGLKLAGAPFKRLVAMEGLGIRDLKRCDDDLLILAGPTTNLSGPCAIYRWRYWLNEPAQDADKVRLHRPERIVEIPFGRGVDHPEGLALWDENGRRRILVLCDSPAPKRLNARRKRIDADLFDLPD